RSLDYEHLLIAMRAGKRDPVVTYMRLPHPSGLAADATRGVVHVASTRNPNQVYDFRPAIGLASGSNGRFRALPQRPLVPVRANFFPGAFTCMIWRSSAAGCTRMPSGRTPSAGWMT